jgi:DNA polymerase-3 subunit epsilon
VNLKKLFPFLFPKKRKERTVEFKRKTITKLEDLKKQVNAPFNFVVFDTETNGFTKRQGVLSVSALKYFFDGENFTHIGEFERFYLPKGKLNKEAVAVNGLTKRVIKKHRKGHKYPKYWFQDIRSFREFIGTDTELIVGHNSPFDRSFYSSILNNSKVFCTMQSNRQRVKALDKNGRVKAPKLIETAISYNIPIEEEKLHASDYDTYLTGEIFKKMIVGEIKEKEIVF